ncbi:cysteine--tRNA ligase [bacterium]|nr:cysteine--tRNA ligase [bacterium]
MTLHLYNSLTRKNEAFAPIDPKQVRLYACGPTVYDRAHIGNARAVVVYDVLFRLLRQIYGDNHVTYVRNITDVDDKINAAATQNGETIQALTTRVTGWFHADMEAIGALPPTHEPRATQYIPQMQDMIQKLIDQGAAYAVTEGPDTGHVLFAVEKCDHYGELSGRKLDELVAGARVAVESYKRHPGDFVLWKPAAQTDDPSSIFDSPWGKGRPGWHIECSAMSHTLLGENFDLHGGGADLKFPHHENEIAQSTCAYPGSHFATTWVHNGFVTVAGEKMSKSLGNFTTVRQLLDQGIKGEVIRLVFLGTHYRKPLDWNEKSIADAKAMLDGWYRILARYASLTIGSQPLPETIMQAMNNDMNLPETLAAISAMTKELNSLDANTPSNPEKALALLGTLQWLGLLNESADTWFGTNAIPAEIIEMAEKRLAAKRSKDFAAADKLRADITALGYSLEDTREGYNIHKI